MVALRSTSKKSRTRLDVFKEAAELRVKTGFRSALEAKAAKQLDAAGITWLYEQEKLQYVVPSRTARYIPDFKIGDPPIYIECKGWPFEAEDRQKMILVKEQHPDKDIRIVFQNDEQKLYSGSKTTVGMWAKEHGFKYSTKGTIPDAWLEEIVK